MGDPCTGRRESGIIIDLAFIGPVEDVMLNQLGQLRSLVEQGKAKLDSLRKGK